MRAALPAVLLGLAACSAAPSPASPAPLPAARLLGAAQDGGLPQLLCSCRNCAAAAGHPDWSRRVAALAVIARDGRWWLIDATPDLPEQVRAMGRLPEGIFLTHAHIGHYTGLMYLGRESASTVRLPVYCSARMADFLRGNGPWSQLVALHQIELRECAPGQAVDLDGELSVTPVPVPHRDEYSDTCAYRLQARGGRSLLYLPDTDRWDGGEYTLRSLAGAADYALLDGTFFSPASELPGRPPSEVPHPPVAETLERLTTFPHGQVVFIHLNHSNPLWDSDSAESEQVRAAGCRTALELREFPLER